MATFLSTTIQELSISRASSFLFSQPSLHSIAYPTTFQSFPKLPFELRLKIYHLMLIPRYIHYNPQRALRSNLTLDSQIPPLLHINHESRTFAATQYSLHNLGARRLYLHLTLDVILWIRYPDSGSSSRAFRADANRLLQDTQNSSLDIPRFAISVKYWNRIVKKEFYRELYERIRGGVEMLWIVDDIYGAMEGEKIKGTRVGLRRWRKKDVGRGRELWRVWDEISGVENGDEEERLPEVEFKRVVFMLRNRA
jgi:2EXR family